MLVGAGIHGLERFDASALVVEARKIAGVETAAMCGRCSHDEKEGCLNVIFIEAKSA